MLVFRSECESLRPLISNLVPDVAFLRADNINQVSDYEIEVFTASLLAPLLLFRIGDEMVQVLALLPEEGDGGA
jgi:hypothetical protein